MLGEVGNWLVIWWQVVSRLFVSKIIWVWWCINLQSKMLGMFFYWDTVYGYCLSRIHFFYYAAMLIVFSNSSVSEVFECHIVKDISCVLMA